MSEQYAVGTLALADLAHDLELRDKEIERLRLMLGSLLAVTAGRMEEAEVIRQYGKLGLDVMRRAREALGDV
jgi:hypothetical protein